MNQIQRRREALATQIARLREHVDGLHRDYADLLDGAPAERSRAAFAKVVRLLEDLERDLEPPQSRA